MTSICETELSVEMGDGTIVKILKIVAMISIAAVDRIQKTISMEGVAYVTILATNLKSGSYIRRKVLYVTFKNDKDNMGMVVVTERNSGSIVMKWIEENSGLYEMLLAANIGSKLS